MPPTSASADLSVLRPYVTAERLVHRLPAFGLRGSGARIALALGVGRLSLQLATTRQPIGRQPPVIERGTDRAARLARVATVREPARGGEIDDVVEDRADALVCAGDLERADPRRVDEHRPTG